MNRIFLPDPARESTIALGQWAGGAFYLEDSAGCVFDYDALKEAIADYTEYLKRTVEPEKLIAVLHEAARMAKV